MINKEFFFKGFRSILAPDSPALALGCCFIAIGALLKNLGFNIQESIFFNNAYLRITWIVSNGRVVISWSISIKYYFWLFGSLMQDCIQWQFLYSH